MLCFDRGKLLEILSEKTRYLNWYVCVFPPRSRVVGLFCLYVVFFLVREMRVDKSQLVVHSN